MLALEKFANEHQEDDLEWLCNKTDLENDDIAYPSIYIGDERLLMFLEYQAFVFGFYYQLTGPLLCHDFSDGEGYVRTVWGFRDKYLLDMCARFAQDCRRSPEGTNRTMLLRFLATMYAGRQAQPPNAPSSGLMAVLGSISIISLSLLRPTSDPADLAKIAIVTLPVLELLQEGDGELFAAEEGGSDIEYRIPARKEMQPVSARGPSAKWSVHAKMGVLVAERLTGVVMAARCAGRLVGAFSPLRADITQIGAHGSSPCPASQGGQARPSSIRAFETTEHDFKDGYLARPVIPGDVVVVQSFQCPAMQYAAGGLYVGWKIAFAVDGDLEAAVARLEGDVGVIIT